MLRKYKHHLAGGAISLHLFLILTLNAAGLKASSLTSPQNENLQDQEIRVSDDSESDLKELRIKRIKLLDQQQLAESSDDDDLAERIGNEIKKIETLILEKEFFLNHNQSTCSMPGGLEDGLLINLNLNTPYGSKLMDVSKKQYCGDVKGPVWSENGAYTFDGIDDYFELSLSKFMFSGNDCSISLCLRLNDDLSHSFPHNQTLISQRKTKDTKFSVNISLSNRIGAHLKYGSRENEDFFIASDPSPCEINPSKWNHIVMTLSSTELKIYINGKLDKTAQVASLLDLENSPVIIGNSPEKKSGCFAFKGQIDDLSIWNRVLTEAEVMGLCFFYQHD